MATKDEIKEKLDELGVEYDSGAKKSELQKLLDGDKPKEESEEEVDGEEVESEEEDEEELPNVSLGKTVPHGKGVYNVFKKGGDFVRSYDEETHGKNAKKLANEFAKKNQFVMSKG